MQKAFSCLVCGHAHYIDTGKHPRDRQQAQIVRCANCGHEQMYPLLDEQEIHEEYATDKTVKAAVEKEADGDLMDKMRLKFSEWTVQHVNMYWDKMQQHRRVLELASGYGYFAEKVNERIDKNFTIEGVEIGDYRLENYVGGTVHNINFLTDPVPSDMRGQYDFILCMHLLEHLNQPVEYLKKIKPLLAPGGEVLFEVPNIHCFLAELSPVYRDFVYVYEHVSYFTPDTLRLAFQLAGYRVKRVYTQELYSIENHIRWVREGTPFTKYNQMFLPDSRLEFINEIYKKHVSDMGKGFALIIEADLES